MLKLALASAASATLLAASANAAIVQVDVYGVVDFNVIQGSHAGIPSGTPTHMSFTVDSDVFVNSGPFPTRGYPIDLSSWQMSVGAAAVNIIDPQPFGGTAYFQLRDNDPAVDGFAVSSSVDNFFPIGVLIPGLVPNHELDFHATYPGSTLSSLDILDAVGSYDLTGIQVYQWTIGRFGNPGAEYAYQSMTITVIPTPGAFALVGVAGFASMRRRR